MKKWFRSLQEMKDGSAFNHNVKWLNDNNREVYIAYPMVDHVLSRLVPGGRILASEDAERGDYVAFVGYDVPEEELYRFIRMEPMGHYPDEVLAATEYDAQTFRPEDILIIDKEYFGEEPYRVLNTLLVQGVPPLHHWKIKKLLGAGFYGIAFLLENDHVLKIFRTEHHSEEDATDLQRYQDLEHKIFTGRASKYDLPVYQSGEIDNSGVGFVEMARVNMDFKTGNQDFDQNRGETDRDWLADLMLGLIYDTQRYLGQMGFKTDDQVQALSIEDLKAAVADSIDTETAARMQWKNFRGAPLDKFLLATAKLIKEHGFRHVDIHGGNIGKATYDSDVIIPFDV